jgi:hypothetical protein
MCLDALLLDPVFSMAPCVLRAEESIYRRVRFCISKDICGERTPTAITVFQQSHRFRYGRPGVRFSRFRGTEDGLFEKLVLAGGMR